MSKDKDDEPINLEEVFSCDSKQKLEKVIKQYGNSHWTNSIVILHLY